MHLAGSDELAHRSRLLSERYRVGPFLAHLVAGGAEERHVAVRPVDLVRVRVRTRVRVRVRVWVRVRVRTRVRVKGRVRVRVRVRGRVIGTWSRSMWSTPSRLREPSTDSMICDGTKGPNQTLTLTLMRALALSLALALTLTLTLARILTLALSHLVAGDAGAAAVLAEPGEALVVAADLGGDG